MIPNIIQVARLKAATKRSYLSFALYGLTPIERPGLGTVACDSRWRFYYDLDVIKGWSVDELAGAMIHEVGHLLRRHAARSKEINADHSMFNIASDFEINSSMRKEGLVLPEGSCFPEQDDMPDGLLAEEYYRMMEKKAEEERQQQQQQQQEQQQQQNQQTDQNQQDQQNQQNQNSDQSAESNQPSQSDESDESNQSDSEQDNQNGQGSQDSQDSQDNQSNQAGNNQPNQGNQGNQDNQDSQGNQSNQSGQNSQNGQNQSGSNGDNGSNQSSDQANSNSQAQSNQSGQSGQNSQSDPSNQSGQGNQGGQGGQGDHGSQGSPDGQGNGNNNSNQGLSDSSGQSSNSSSGQSDEVGNGDGQQQSDTTPKYQPIAGRPGEGHCGSCATGIEEDYEEPIDSEFSGIGEDKAKSLINKTAVKIINESKSRGDVPAGWQRWAEKVLSPNLVDWRRKLRSMVRTGKQHVAGAVDYSRHRPSRRQSAFDKVVMPSLRQPIPSIAVIIDTSGSISDKMVSMVLSEIKGILKATSQSDGAYVIACDAEVHWQRKVKDVREVKVLGGGGTDMRVAIRAALKIKPQPNLIICLTDGYTPWPILKPAKTDLVIAQIGPLPSSDYPIPNWSKRVLIQEREVA